MLSYLNAGGSAEDLAASLATVVRDSEPVPDRVRADLTKVDLTGDGVRELLFDLEIPGFPWQESILVLGCATHEYQILIEVSSPLAGWIAVMALGDLNADGKTELAYRTGNDRIDHGMGVHRFNIVAWEGRKFRQLIQTDDGGDSALGAQELSPVSRFEDRDGDGIKELIAYSGVGSGYWICGMYSMRGTTATWRWDGEHYVLQREDPDPPRYSYEALEDGDRLAALGYFEEAILSYLRAISDTSLKAGTPAYWRVR